MLLLSFFADNLGATDADVERLVASNVCRCTGYGSIIAAAKRYRTEFAHAAPPYADT